MNYHLAFSYSPVGPKVFSQLLDHFGDLELVWGASAEDLKPFQFGEIRYGKFDEFRKKFDIEKVERALEEKKILFVDQDDESFPKGLHMLDSVPIGIYVKGEIEALSHDPAIGVVGARKITTYGRRVTDSIVSGLVRRGASIVSGLALGVDGQAHISCLDAGGVAVAVLGNGVDMAVPVENTNLYRRIIESGGAVVSEYPPGTPPTKGSFPSRNRIIAALSESLVVTEAAEGSGSLITAGYARDLGKRVFAVPGQVGSYGAKGVHRLIKEGAEFAETADDILKKEKVNEGKVLDLGALNLSEEERVVMERVMQDSCEIDELSIELSIGAERLSVIISSLEIGGYVRREGGKVERDI